MKPLMKKQTYLFIHIWLSNNYLKWRDAATWWTEINCYQTWVGSKYTPGNRLRVKLPSDLIWSDLIWQHQTISVCCKTELLQKKNITWEEMSKNKMSKSVRNQHALPYSKSKKHTLDELLSMLTTLFWLWFSSMQYLFAPRANFNLFLAAMATSNHIHENNVQKGN